MQTYSNSLTTLSANQDWSAQRKLDNAKIIEQTVQFAKSYRELLANNVEGSNIFSTALKERRTYEMEPIEGDPTIIGGRVPGPRKDIPGLMIEPLAGLGILSNLDHAVAQVGKKRKTFKPLTEVMRVLNKKTKELNREFVAIAETTVTDENRAALEQKWRQLTEGTIMPVQIGAIGVTEQSVDSCARDMPTGPKDHCASTNEIDAITGASTINVPTDMKEQDGVLKVAGNQCDQINRVEFAANTAVDNVPKPQKKATFAGRPCSPGGGRYNVPLPLLNNEEIDKYSAKKCRRTDNFLKVIKDNKEAQIAADNVVELEGLLYTKETFKEMIARPEKFLGPSSKPDNAKPTDLDCTIGLSALNPNTLQIAAVAEGKSKVLISSLDPSLLTRDNPEAEQRRLLKRINQYYVDDNLSHNTKPTVKPTVVAEPTNVKVYRIGAPTKHPSFLVNVKVAGCPLKAVFDTGSAVTVLDYTLYQSKRQLNKLQLFDPPKDVILTAANGVVLPIKGVLRQPIEFGPRNLVWEIYVLEHLSGKGMLLDLDLINK